MTNTSEQSDTVGRSELFKLYLVLLTCETYWPKVEGWEGLGRVKVLGYFTLEA